MMDKEASAQVRSIVNTPSVEEQLISLPPSRELLDFYRKRLAFYEKELTRVAEGDNSRRRAFDAVSELRDELKRCGDDISRLQKALSDTQVYLTQERTNVVALQTDKDWLKFQVAAERRKNKFLLDLCQMTEENADYLMCERKVEEWTEKAQKLLETDVNQPLAEERKNTALKENQELRKKVTVLERQIRELTLDSRGGKEKLRETVTTLQNQLEDLNVSSSKEAQALRLQNDLLERQVQEFNSIGDHEKELLHMKLAHVEKQLNDVINNSQQEIFTLQKDREVMFLEMEVERKKLQEEVSNLNDKLAAANSQLSEHTVSYLNLKHAFELKEERDMWQRYRKWHKKKGSSENVEHDKSDGEHKMKTDSKMKILKEKIENKDNMIQSYKRKCEDLENEVSSLKSTRLVTVGELEAKVERLKAQVAFEKSLNDKLAEKKNREAEGIESDVRLLKEEVVRIKRKAESCKAQHVTENEKNAAEVREILDISYAMDKVLENIILKVKMYGIRYGSGADDGLDSE